MKKIQIKTDQNNPQIRAYKEAVEKGKQNQHVLLRGQMWVVKRADSDQERQAFETRKAAVKYAESVANQGTAIFVHDARGTIHSRKDF